MNQIPFPNSHDMDDLNTWLDARVAGTPMQPANEVEAAADSFHTLAESTRSTTPGYRVAKTKGDPVMQAVTLAATPPVSRRTRRQASAPSRTRTYPWISAAMVLALVLGTFVFALIDPPGSNRNNNIAYAPQVASPMAEEPLNPDTAPWIADFSYQDCRESSDAQQVEINYDAQPMSEPQGYRVIGPADRIDAASVSDQYRAMRGCANLHSAWAYWSEARIYEHSRILNETNQGELAEMQEYFSGVYPQQFMAVAEGLQVSPDVRQEWEARLKANMLGQPIPLGAKLNPAWAVELSDGRIAIPATFMYSVHDPAIMANGLPTEYPASTVVIVFTLEDGDWKYDDSLLICIVNCTSGMSNPLDPEINPWAVPSAAVECPADEGIPFTGLESSPIAQHRSYATIGTPPPDTVDNTIPTLNVAAGCTQYSGPMFTISGATSMQEVIEPGSMESEALAPFFIQSERGGTQIILENPQLSQMEVVESPPYTMSLPGPDGNPMQASILLSGSMDNVARTKYQFSQFDANRAVLLDDGRIAMTTTVLLSNQDRGAIFYEGDPELWPMPVLILKNVDGQMLIDEVVSRPRYVGLVTPSYSWWWDSRFIPTVAPTPIATPKE